MMRPSGVHVGCDSEPAAVVRRVTAPPERVSRKRSVFPGPARLEVNTTDCPLGLQEGSTSAVSPPAISANEAGRGKSDRSADPALVATNTRRLDVLDHAGAVSMEPEKPKSFGVARAAPPPFTAMVHSLVTPVRSCA